MTKRPVTTMLLAAAMGLTVGVAHAQGPRPPGKPSRTLAWVRTVPAVSAGPKTAPGPAAPTVAPSPGAALAPATPSAAAVPAVAPAPPPPPGPPRPAPELEQAKWMLGAWRCDGKAPAGALGPNSPAYDYKSKIILKKDLNNFAIAAEYEQRKSKVNPAGYHGKMLITYDALQQQFVVMGVDSTGGWYTETGGPDGDKMVSEGHAVLGGKKMTLRETFTKTGDKTMSWRGEVKTPGAADWQTIGEDNCKK